MGILRNNLGRYTNCKHCNSVDLILKHNQKGLKLGRVKYIFHSASMISSDVLTSHEEVSWPLTLLQEIQNMHISNRDINVTKGGFFFVFFK